MKDIFEIYYFPRKVVFLTNVTLSTSSKFLVENGINLMKSDLCKHIKTQILKILLICCKYLRSTTRCGI